MRRGRIEAPRFDSAQLQGNRPGDPSEREVLVYLPPGYADSIDRRYPLLMVLPAYAATHRSFTNFRVWQPDIFEMYEALLAEGAVPEAIIVSPDCMTRWGGSQFIDSEAQGPYQRYLVDEVLPFVDARYRTIAKRDARGVMGHSSGGFGALRLGLDRPETFSAYVSHAGDSLFEVSLRPSFTSVAITLDRAGGIEGFLSRFEEKGPRGGGDFEAIMTIACAVAYSPNLELPLPFAELPFDIETGLPIASVWEKWQTHDPLVRLKNDPDAFKDASLVYLDAGDRDEHGLQFGARLLAKALEERGAPVVYEEFEGGHRGTSYRFRITLPKILGALASR